ncbi:thiosulfate:glutathione sulfurtransferase-like [Kryptolebias marmoratus]|uniref:Thiosulfate sulfurtransferase like domain containing 1 n=1 Tax=Kryptolebias marmoratus TaxID=37003 RepID=A0A3Q3BIF7_KRYMA|nr:thiosulfate:glutathione sulfurtransferase-like [Kryptolebias marmoratus]
MANSVSYNDLKGLVGKSPNLILIDVRTKEEVARGRIPGAAHIPLNEVETALQMNPDDFQAKYGIPKPAKLAPELVFHCQSGRRGEVAMRKAHQLGYEKARNYSGGYSDWSMRERK